MLVLLLVISLGVVLLAPGVILLVVPFLVLPQQVRSRPQGHDKVNFMGRSQPTTKNRTKRTFGHEDEDENKNTMEHPRLRLGLSVINRCLTTADLNMLLLVDLLLVVEHQLRHLKVASSPLCQQRRQIPMPREALKASRKTWKRTSHLQDENLCRILLLPYKLWVALMRVYLRLVTLMLLKPEELLYFRSEKQGLLVLSGAATVGSRRRR